MSHFEDQSTPSEDGRMRSEFLTWNDIQGEWHVFKGKVREKWGELTNDDVEQIGGYYEALAGKIQQVYNVDEKEAKRQIDEWMLGRFDTHETDEDANPTSPI